MDIKKELISRKVVIFETPPDLDDLKKMTDAELYDHSINHNILREQIDGIKDEDKRRTFMINENLRIHPPSPPHVNPVLTDSNYDMVNMEKNITMEYVRHITDKKTKKYLHSIVKKESYDISLQRHEIDCLEKEKLLSSIKDEVSKLNLSDYKCKEDIMKFACDNSHSNGEKRRRAVFLQKALQEKGDKRYRITTFDISVY